MEHSRHLVEIANDAGKSKEYGINRNSILNDLRYWLIYLRLYQAIVENKTHCISLVPSLHRHFLLGTHYIQPHMHMPALPRKSIVTKLYPSIKECAWRLRTRLSPCFDLLTCSFGFSFEPQPKVWFVMMCII